MDCQVDKKSHFRHLLLFAFNRGQKASEATRDICAVYGKDAIAERTARDWFARFKHDNFDLNDAPRSGGPAEMDEDQLGHLLKEDGRQTSREVGEKMNCDFATISRHLQSMGFTQKLGASRTNSPKNRRISGFPLLFKISLDTKEPMATGNVSYTESSLEMRNGVSMWIWSKGKSGWVLERSLSRGSRKTFTRWRQWFVYGGIGKA